MSTGNIPILFYYPVLPKLSLIENWDSGFIADPQGGSKLRKPQSVNWSCPWLPLIFVLCYNYWFRGQCTVQWCCFLNSGLATAQLPSDTELPEVGKAEGPPPPQVIKRDIHIFTFTAKVFHLKSLNLSPRWMSKGGRSVAIIIAIYFQ